MFVLMPSSGVRLTGRGTATPKVTRRTIGRFVTWTVISRTIVMTRSDVH